MTHEAIWEATIEGPGAYDVVGDVHGCWEALRRLCTLLGYDERLTHPGRKLVFVGDLINRGPDSVSVLRAVIGAVEKDHAHAVLGNHDEALRRFLHGHEGEFKADIAETIAAIDHQADHDTLWERIKAYLDSRPLILDLDEQRLTVVHGAFSEEPRHDRRPETRHYLLNGEAIGKSPQGKTLRRDWAAEYRGAAFVVYGHTPVPRPQIRYNTLNVDTGAVRGKLLTVLRWPERTTVSVPSGYSYKPD